MSDQRVYWDKGLNHQMKLRFTCEDMSRVENLLKLHRSIQLPIKMERDLVRWVYASVYYKAQQISAFDHFY